MSGTLRRRESISSIDSTDSMVLRRNSITSTIGSFSTKGTSMGSMSSISRRRSSIDDIDYSMEEEEKEERPIRLEKAGQHASGLDKLALIKEYTRRLGERAAHNAKMEEEEKEERPIRLEKAGQHAAGLEELALIKEYTRRLGERAAHNAKTAEEELEKERRAHQETKERPEKMEQEAEERRRELQYLQARQSSWVTETIKLAAVGLGVLLLRQLFVMLPSHDEFVPIY